MSPLHTFESRSFLLHLQPQTIRRHLRAVLLELLYDQGCENKIRLEAAKLLFDIVGKRKSETRPLAKKTAKEEDFCDDEEHEERVKEIQALLSKFSEAKQAGAWRPASGGEPPFEVTQAQDPPCGHIDPVG